jgi:hypothetical protein
VPESLAEIAFRAWVYCIDILFILPPFVVILVGSIDIHRY